MSTRAYIAQKKGDTYRVIYNHHDGYEEHLGAVLRNYYDTDEKVSELIDLGDVSYVGESIESVIAYSRDCNEDYNDVKPREFNSLEELEKYCNESFNYLFKDGKWRRI